jgi:protein required for attachment to host cells
MTGVRYPSPVFLISHFNKLMKIKIGDLVILVDREHCHLLTINPHTEQVHLLTLCKFVNDVAISHLIPRDGPGRTYNRAAGRKTAYEQINPRKIRDHQFFVDLDPKIKAEWESGDFDRVILVGEPEVLHELKEVLSPHLLQKVCCEINKNYINTPISNLEKILKTA